MIQGAYSRVRESARSQSHDFLHEAGDMGSMTNNTDSDGLLTEVAAADLLQLSNRTLQTWRCKGIGPTFIRAGRAIRYRRSDLIRWVDSNAVLSERPNPRQLAEAG